MFCPNCGKSVPDDARFCDSCGAMLSQPSQPEQPQQPAQADIPEPFNPSWDGVQPAEAPAPKKSHGKLIAGLVALAVVIIGVVTAGLLTDWFGLASGEPMDMLSEALEEYKDVDSFTFSLGMDAEIEGSPMKANFDFDFDRKNDAALGNMSVNYGGMTMEIPMGYYQNNVVMELMGQRAAIDMSGLMNQTQTQAPVSNEEVDAEELIDAIFETLEQQYPDLYEEMAQEMDMKKLKSCVKEICETAGTEEWRKEYAGFTYEKDGGDKILSYDPNLKEIAKFLLENIRPAFNDPSVCDEALGELKEATELDGIRMPFTITVKKDKSIEFALTLSGLPEGEEVPTEMTIRFGLSNPNKAKVDTGKLEEMLDGAETIPAEQFFGLDALNEMSSAYDESLVPPIDNDGTTASNDGSIVGTWGGYVDMTSVIGGSMQDELGGTSSISEPLMMGMRVTFNEDGTGSMAINVEDFATQVMDSMPEQSGMTREELTSSMGMDDLKFYYELKDGKLYTWNAGEENDRECLLATLVDSKTLILDAEDCTDLDDEAEGILPLILSRT